MILLVLGVVLCVAAHLASRLVPSLMSHSGRPGAARIALWIVLVVSVVMMVVGYGRAGEEGGPVWWGPLPPLVKANNLVMLGACYLFAAGLLKTSLTRDLRQPFLWALVLWAVAHLLVNGDPRSFVLFGGLGVWAPLQMLLVNRLQPGWTPPPARPRKYEVYALICTFAVFIGAIAVHYALGYAVIG